MAALWIKINSHFKNIKVTHVKAPPKYSTFTHQLRHYSLNIRINVCLHRVPSGVRTSLSSAQLCSPNPWAYAHCSTLTHMHHSGSAYSSKWTNSAQHHNHNSHNPQLSLHFRCLIYRVRWLPATKNSAAGIWLLFIYYSCVVSVFLAFYAAIFLP